MFHVDVTRGVDCCYCIGWGALMSDSDQTVYELMFDRLSVDKALTERGKQLVLAAFEDDQQLAAVLAGDVISSNVEARRTKSDTTPRMFLSAIHAQGFRGIGPASTLPLQPGAGLTLVTGRNGSGKSSFAEAAELVLTGDNKRWSAKENNQRLWRDGWRNLHGTPDGLACIGVDLVISGDTEPTSLRKTWPQGTDLDKGTLTRQRRGEKRETIEGPPWPTDVELYRPFLSYSELGSLLDGKPTQLHAALYRLLGLGSLDDASDRLKAVRGELDHRVKELKDERLRLVGQLGEIDDDRARAAAALLSRTAPNLVEVAELALGDDQTLTEISSLRTLATLFIPSSADVSDAVERIRAALDRLAEIRTSDAARSDEIAALLRGALTHQADQDCSCPVCGVGTLDAEWRRRAQAQVERLERNTAELREANRSLAAVVGEARLLVAAPPPALNVVSSGVDNGPVLAAWHDWEQAGRLAEPAALANALESVHPQLTKCLDELRAAAETALSQLDEVWRPMAVRLFAWHDQAQQVAADAALLRDVRNATEWLKNAGAELRDQRMSPFASQSQAVWEQLRQQSSVDLDTVRLTGTGSMRKVVLEVTVDGSAGAALSVMSQGELHALALSLFLPRATVAQSPFRFLVIDDPVQAMDPAKVEGLARVLAQVALTRQVVVFTHDDRLPEVLRRLELAATVLEVCRRDRSKVELRTCSDPVTRYLDDARSIASTKEMPDELRRELVATYCRNALEAAAQAKVRAVRLGRGDAYADVEAALADAPKVKQVLTLAIFDDASRGKDLLPRLNTYGSWAADTVQACAEGAHHAPSGDPHCLITDAKRLAERLRA